MALIITAILAFTTRGLSGDDKAALVPGEALGLMGKVARATFMNGWMERLRGVRGDGAAGCIRGGKEGGRKGGKVEGRKEEGKVGRKERRGVGRER